MSIAICLLMITSISASLTQNVRQLSIGGMIFVDDDNTSGIEDGSLLYPYSTIQKGVNAASSKDTVYVFNGTYYENVVLDKTINLIGENRNTTIIDGGELSHVVDIKSDWVNVSDFTITRSGKWSAGILINSVQNCQIKGNYFVNNHYGIRIAQSTNNKFYSNKMENCGIHISYLSEKNTFTTQEIPTNNTVNNKPLYYYKNINMNNVSVPLNAGQVILGNISWLKIENLDVSDGSVGILLGYSSYNYIANNTCNSNDDCGIYIGNSNNNTIVKNICNSNRAHGILLISHSNDNIVKNNKCDSNGIITKGGGIRLSQYSNENNISHNTCNFNFRGINLGRSSNNTIISNDCSFNNEIGIFHTSSGYNTIESNLFLSNGECGIYFDSTGSQYNTIMYNNCSNNRYGIRFWVVVDNNTIKNNDITNNDYGIWLRRSSDNNIMGNNVFMNGNEGIYLFSSSNNFITSNNISNNRDGIYLESSSTNRIFHNYITNNTNQAYDDRDDNYWDDGYPSGGNYWSDYTGADNFNGPYQNKSGSDGIGDTPYPILGGSNQDRYPLVPWKIDNQLPVTNAGSDQIINEGDTVQFNASASYDPDGTIETYEWDFDSSDGLWWETGATPDATEPTPTHTYGDDGVFIVTLRVTDNNNMSATDTCNITVQNVDPTVTIESITMEVEIGLRVAGRKYNNVSMTLYEEGSSSGYVSIERMTGSPNEQMAWIPVSINFSKSYNATVFYTPEDPPNIGGNPVWIYIKSKDGSINKIHHTFNVQQSKKRDSDHWNHVEPWEVDLNAHFVGLPFEITSHITDPGSDDETLTFTYGSQVKTVTYLNNPPIPDPYPSPAVNPRDIMDTTTLIYEGPGTVMLTVEDDDDIRLGVGDGSDSFSVG